MSIKKMMFLLTGMFLGAYAPLHAQEKSESVIAAVAKAHPLVQAQLITATGLIVSSIGLLLHGNWPLGHDRWFLSAILFIMSNGVLNSLGERFGQLPDKELKIFFENMHGLGGVFFSLGLWGKLSIAVYQETMELWPILFPMVVARLLGSRASIRNVADTAPAA